MERKGRLFQSCTGPAFHRLAEDGGKDLERTPEAFQTGAARDRMPRNKTRLEAVASPPHKSGAIMAKQATTPL